jgi:hypothetical protein
MGAADAVFEWPQVNFSYEGLIGLAGAALILAGLPVLLFGDYFDPAKRPTKLENVAAILCAIGMCLAIVAFLLMISTMM